MAFGRPDVDRFLSEIDHEQYREWCDFLTLEPAGWQATRIAAARLSFITAQVHSRKRLKERDYDINIAGNVHSPETERARWEAMSVRQSIQVQ